MSTKSYAYWLARLHVARDAYRVAGEHQRTIPREHRDEAVEWGILRETLRHEIVNIRRQATKAMVRESVEL